MSSFNHTHTTIRVSTRLCFSICVMAVWNLSACSSTPPSEVNNPVSKNLEIMAPNDGDAIGGYDPVSYFLDGGPREGVQAFFYRWRDATWLFTTAEHRELFKNNPLQYAPAYGGWCAYGMTENYAAESDPLNAWTIHDGKLYLNWDAEVMEDWRLENATLLVTSEENWPGVRQGLQNSTAEIYWHDDE